MKKSLLGILILAIFCFVTAPAAFAVEIEDMTDAEIDTLMNKQRPMAQADIDKYIKMLPILLAPDLNPHSPEFEAALADIGWVKERAFYVAVKTTIGYSSLLEPDIDELARDAIRPTPAEMTLIKNNMEKLTEAYNKAY